MIRDAILHLMNEQPLQADLFERPSATDMGLLCTNLRSMSGARPLWIDHIESVFFFPYTAIRFIEMAPGSEGAPGLPSGLGAEQPGGSEPAAGAPGPDAGPDAELEIDEDFLRRVRDA